MSHVDVLKKIFKFLNVPFGKITQDAETQMIAHTFDNATLSGTVSIIEHAASKSKKLTTKSSEDNVFIHQWVEYANTLLYIKNFSLHRDVLKELNSYLSTRTFFVAQELSIADIALYYVLQNILANLSPQDKVQYIHVCRWFDNIQQDVSVRQNLPILNFDTNFALQSVTVC